MSDTYLPEGLPQPTVGDPLSAPYWEATRQGKLRIQNAPLRCLAVGTGVGLLLMPFLRSGMEEVAGQGRIYSYQRPHHPVHAALNGHGPYVVVLVELPHAGNVRMVGNLLGDPRQEVRIGAAVAAVFEPHDGADPPFTLVQWRVA